MKRQHYALFSCDVWKSNSTMKFMGVFTKPRLLRIIRREIKDNNFEYGCPLSTLEEEDVRSLNDMLTYGYIEEITINEEL